MSIGLLEGRNRARSLGYIVSEAAHRLNIEEDRRHANYNGIISTFIDPETELVGPRTMPQRSEQPYFQNVAVFGICATYSAAKYGIISAIDTLLSISLRSEQVLPGPFWGTLSTSNPPPNAIILHLAAQLLFQGCLKCSCSQPKKSYPPRLFLFRTRKSILMHAVRDLRSG